MTQTPRGFTIMEIMIATAILSMGLLGILALFPVAIDSGRKVMERSTAVTIAKSVAEQIRAGIRNQKRYVTSRDMPYTYFIFHHDGVKDPIPRDSSLERPSGDYYILLPRFRPAQAFSGPKDPESRMKAVTKSADFKEFVFPEDDDSPNGGGDPGQADNDGDDHPDGSKILVKKVYTLGNLLPGPDEVGEMVLEDQKYDTYKQYSFAFSIRVSMYDTNLSLNPGQFQPGNDLYHVRVMVFRSFHYNAEKVIQEGKGQEPVYEIDFEVTR